LEIASVQASRIRRSNDLVDQYCKDDRLVIRQGWRRLTRRSTRSIAAVPLYRTVAGCSGTSLRSSYRYICRERKRGWWQWT